jgi:hypothetical protein
MLRLLGPKIVLTLGVLFLLPSLASGQKIRGNFNYFDYQKKPYYFGITLGLNVSKFRVLRTDDFINSDSIQTIESLSGPGFNLGIITNLKAGEYFDFRLLPTLSFTDRRLQFGRNGRTVDQSFSSVWVEIPFHVRYKSAPFKDKRIYLLAGVKYGFDVAAKARSRQDPELLDLSSTEFAIEYGAGVQFFLPFFIFSPEIKISHGIGSSLIFNAEKSESSLIQKLLSRTITVAFHFEG